MPLPMLRSERGANASFGRAGSIGWALVVSRREAGVYLTQREFDSVVPRLTPTQAVVYIALATTRNAKTGSTPPLKVGLLVMKTGVGRTQCYAALKALELAGLIERRRSQRGTFYQFPAWRKSGIPDS